jgi:hypothetical protein
MADTPPQDYYPSAKIRLTLRFDEFGAGTSLASAPKTIIKQLNGISALGGPLVVTTDPTAPAGTTRYLVTAQGTSAPAPYLQSSSSDGFTYQVTIIPKEMTWNINGLQSASTLTAALKLRDCPIDPRTLRSVVVESFMGGVSASDFLQGIQGATRSSASIGGQSEPLNCLADTYVDSNGMQRTNSRFIGWADKWVVEWMGNSEPMIHIDARDNTQLLIEQDAPAKAVINMNKPLDQAVAGYLANFNQFQGMSVQFLPTTDTPPTLSTATGGGNLLSQTAFRPQLGPNVAHGGQAGKLSVWDYLTQICGMVGCSIRVDGTTLIIQRPRSLVSPLAGARADDPYQARTINGVTYPYRTFIYGRNVKELHINRNYTKNVPKNIEVRSYDTDSKTVQVARNRPDGSSSTAAQGVSPTAIPGSAQPVNTWTEFRVAGVKDPITLQNIAQSVYVQRGTKELTVEIKTDNQASFGGGNQDPDILDMKFGDTFEVLIAQDATSEVNTPMFVEAQLQSASLTSSFFMNLGFAPDFAAAYAKAYTNVGLPTLFRLKQMKVTWEYNTGLSINVAGISYIVVREDRSLPAGQEPGTTSPSATAPTEANVSQSINDAGSGGQSI